MRQAGVEPATPGFSGQCSNHAELPPHEAITGYALEKSQSFASHSVLVRVVGFEPTLSKEDEVLQTPPALPLRRTLLEKIDARAGIEPAPLPSKGGVLTIRRPGNGTPTGTRTRKNLVSKTSAYANSAIGASRGLSLWGQFNLGV